MVAPLGHRAVLQQDDLVGVHHRAQAVRDHDGDGIRQTAVVAGGQVLQDPPLGAGVHGTEAVVQDPDRGILVDHAGNGHALLLTAGEPHAALADLGGVAFGELRHVLVHRGDAGGAHHGGLVRSAVVREGDVLAHAGREEEAVLRHVGYGPPQVLQGVGADVATVHEDGPGGRLVEAQQEMGKARLPRADRTHDAQRLAGSHREAQATQHVALRAGIAEGQVTDLDVPGLGRNRVFGSRLDRVGNDLEELGEAEERCRSALHRVEHVAQLLERLLEEGEVQQESDQVAKRDLAADGKEAAVPDDRDEAEGRHQRHQGPEDRRQAHEAHLLLHQLRELILEAPFHQGLVAEGLDGADAAHDLLDGLGHLAQGRLEDARLALDLGAEVAYERRDRKERHQARQGEPRVHVEEHEVHRGAQHEDAVDRRIDAHRGDLAHHVHVREGVGQELTGAVAVVVGRGQSLPLAEERVADVESDDAAVLGGEESPQPTQQNPGRSRRQHQERKVPCRRESQGSGRIRVRQPPDQARYDGGQRTGKGDRKHRRDVGQSMPCDVFAQDVPTRARSRTACRLVRVRQ